jgi:acetoacetate decarboxylase
MKLKKSSEEVQAMLNSFKPTFRNNNSIFAYFETDPVWLKEILPAPLTPADQPIGIMMIQKGDNYTGGGLFVTARCGDVVGNYCLAMPMSTDSALIFGRESWGEPKKIAATVLDIDDNDAVGTVSRYGIEMVRMEGVLGDPIPMDSMKNSTHLHFRYSLKPDASGIENTHLIKVDFVNEVFEARALDVKKLELNQSVYDVYGEVPIKKILGGAFARMNCAGRGKYLAKVDDEAYLPYAFYKMDPYDLLLK